MICHHFKIPVSYNIILISIFVASFLVNNLFAGNLSYNRWHEMEMLPLQYKIHFLHSRSLFLRYLVAVSDYVNVFVT